MINRVMNFTDQSDPHSGRGSMTISELIEKARDADEFVAGTAARELLQRSNECLPFIDDLIELLGCENVAVEDLAFRTIQRVGAAATPALLLALPKATGRFRSHILGLVAESADFRTALGVLQHEIKHGVEEMRFWAANCLGRRYIPGGTWSPDAMAFLSECIDMLASTKKDPHLTKYQAQARMTLKHLGATQKDSA